MGMREFFVGLEVPEHLRRVSGVACVAGGANPLTVNTITRAEYCNTSATLQGVGVVSAIEEVKHKTPAIVRGSTPSGSNITTILQLVATNKTPDTPETPDVRLVQEWRERYEERAAIIEHDGGYLRREAEWLAMNDVLTQYSQAYGIPMNSDNFYTFMRALIAAAEFNQQKKGA